jgi:hypothetical protein
MGTLALSVDLLRSFLASLKYHYDDRPDAWHLLGLHGAEPVPDAASLRLLGEPQDRSTDTLVVFGRREHSPPICRCYRASIAPGLPSPYPAAPGTPSRIHLLNGQYHYKLGLQHGDAALVPDGQVKIWRDADQHLIDEGENVIQTGFFPFAIHAGRRETLRRRHAPEGCVVWDGPGGADWESFHELITTRPAARLWFSLVDAADLVAFAVYGAGNIDPAAPEFPAPKRQALEKVRLGLATLAAYPEQAVLPPETGMDFSTLLDRLRHSGVLANIRFPDGTRLPPFHDRLDSRTAMIGGFRVLYQYMIPAGLDHTFHRQLDHLRHFGPLGGL